jgi:C4-dicarboxylate transporter, DctM subunit
MILLLLPCLLLLLAVGLPIAACLGLSALTMILAHGTPLVVVAQRLTASLDSFTLIAVPLFILAGNIMAVGGIARRLVRLSVSLVGWMPGGLAAANVLASMIFGGISGSASADLAAIGSIMIPAMRRAKYDEGYSAALTCAASTLGIMVPPSIPMVLLSAATGTSLVSLFLGSYIPAFIIALALVTAAVTRGLATGEGDRAPFSMKEVGRAFIDGVWALLAPVVIVGSILSGVFSPTEAASLGVVYVTLISCIVYREMTARQLWKTLVSSMATTGVIAFILASAGLFAFVLTSAQVPQTLVAALTAFSESPWCYLLIINVCLLFIGMFLEPPAAIITLSPILLPVALKLGLNPVHFGLMIVINLAIGLIMPPIGINLFVARAISGIPVHRIGVSVLPLIALMLVMLVVIVAFPQLSLWLPDLVRQR